MSCAAESPKIQIFRPNWGEFQDFEKYIEYMEKRGAHKAGLAKVVPPPEWMPRKLGYKSAKNINIPMPLNQVISGCQGFYRQQTYARPSMTVREFEHLAKRYARLNTCTELDNIEALYWQMMDFAPPLYGCDVNESLFDEDLEIWNFNKLPNILDVMKNNFKPEISIPGINSSYLYFGMWRASFAMHTEDYDLYSINYLHYGDMKTWYGIPPEMARKLERILGNRFHSDRQASSAFMRHKCLFMSPEIMNMYDISFDRITQQAGDIIVTFPNAYHMGFSHGYNCGEAVNFGSKRWVEIGKNATQCKCSRQNPVKIPKKVFDVLERL